MELTYLAGGNYFDPLSMVLNLSVGAFFLCVLMATGCSWADPTLENVHIASVLEVPQKSDAVVCTDSVCFGSYQGPEFVNGSDVAHRFSNTMSAKVGDQLKELYAEGHYVKVDFEHIVMTTKGMGTGKVRYFLSIPFKTVEDRCQAFTSFDHVGGWNHAPALEARKRQLQSVLLPGEKLDISKRKKTPEGLEEYWIQWKNKHIQRDCR